MMTINSRIVVRSKAPIKYIVQSGVVVSWVGDGAGGGDGSTGAGEVTTGVIVGTTGIGNMI